MKNIIEKRIAGEGLSYQEAREIMTLIGRGEINPSQIAAFITSYWFNMIQTEELTGFVDAMMELAITLDMDEFDAMDVCGTGGDGKNTFNISTTSSFIIVGAGQKIIKHGNHGVSSSVGSSTVLEFLGNKFTNDESVLKKKLELAGICFLHAPLFHPAMRFVGTVRRELGMKTIFNLLGPLMNPARVKKQITGVYSDRVFGIYQKYFLETEKKFGVLYSTDGYDEISLTSPFILGTREETKEYQPGDLGLEIVNQDDLFGGETVEHSANMMYKILQREGTPAQTNVVLANAGTALWIAEKASSLEEGILMAKDSLESGKAFQVFKKFIVD